MSGYDQFFKKAQSTTSAKTKKVKLPPKSNFRLKKKPQLSAKDKLIEEALRKNFNMEPAPVKKSKGINWKIFSSLAFGLFVTGIGFYDPGFFLGLVDKVEVGFVSKATAASTEAKNSNTKGKKSAKSEANKKSGPGDKNEKLSQRDSEEVSYFSKLRERKERLDLREQELNKLEEELHKQKMEIEKRIAKLEEVRRDIASVLKERVEVDEKKVDKLVEFYSNMKPQQAAQIITDLNEDLAVSVLGKMKKKNAAAIMNLLDANKARTLSEKFAGYKRR